MHIVVDALGLEHFIWAHATFWYNETARLKHLLTSKVTQFGWWKFLANTDQSFGGPTTVENPWLIYLLQNAVGRDTGIFLFIRSRFQLCLNNLRDSIRTESRDKLIHYYEAKALEWGKWEEKPFPFSFIDQFHKHFRCRYNTSNLHSSFGSRENKVAPAGHNM